MHKYKLTICVRIFTSPSVADVRRVHRAQCWRRPILSLQKNLPLDSFFGQISFLHSLSLKSFGQFPSRNVLDAPVLKSSHSTFPRETPTTQVCFHWQHLCNIKATNEILEGFFGLQIWFLLLIPLTFNTHKQLPLPWLGQPVGHPSSSP